MSNRDRDDTDTGVTDPRTTVVDITPNTVDPTEFRIPATDTRGHTQRCYFRAQPGHVQQVVVAVTSRIFPYRTQGDLYRHALARHLRWLDWLSEALGDRMRSVTAEVDAILDVMRDEEFAQDFSLVFEKLSERVAQHLGSGSANEARRLLVAVQNHVKRMPEGYWRNKYSQELDARWGHIIDSAPKASLVKLRQE